jgi:hypothetical protein
MESKELVKRTIEFKEPLRISLDIRSDPEKSDIITLSYNPPERWEVKKKNKGEYDEWGCRWEKIVETGTQSGQAKEHPLANWADFNKYQFPQPHAEGRFENMRKTILRYNDRYIVGALGVSGFYRLFTLRGFENLLTDIYLEPLKFSQLADKVFEFEKEIIKEYGKLKVDAVGFFDDWGTENTLFIRPQKWREIFKPRYKKQFELIHNLGMKVFFHSCGYVWDIIEDLIEIGVDVINLEQPLVFSKEKMNGIDRLAKEFGGKVCFESPVDQQRTLSHGSREEIIQEAKHLIQALGKYNSGFIALADGGGALGIVPEENIRVMMQAFEEYGKMI